MNERCCENCRFLQPSDVEFGECRRSAPKSDPEASPLNPTRWPIVKLHDWCGDFEPVNTIDRE